MKVLCEARPLGDILQLEYGKPLDDADRKPDGLYPVFGANGEKARTDKFYFDKPSIIVGRKGSAGELNLAADKFWPLDVTYFTTFDDNRYDLHFLFYLLTTLELPKLARGVKPGINRNEVYSKAVRVPPLPEQRRIVGVLDDAIGNIDTAKTCAENNFRNAKALFDGHLQNIFTRHDNRWPIKRLGEIAEVQSGGTPLVSQKRFWNGDIRWYSSGELNDLITIKPERQITLAGLESSNAKLFPRGSLLIGMYDTAALKMSILDREAAFNQAIAGVRPNKEIEMEFVLHAINAVKPFVLSQRRGVRQKNLSLEKIKSIRLPFPAISEQRAAVLKLKNVSIETKRLESIYQHKLDALSELKKSLLHQAFAGTL